MKKTPFYLMLPVLFSSCLVIKIYESPKEVAQEPKTPKAVHHQMIGSGKVLDLGEKGSHEIFFYMDDKAPKGVFFKEHLLESHQEAPIDSMKLWVQKGSPKNIRILTSPEQAPLIVMDGKILEQEQSLDSIDPEGIGAMNVLKGASALKKYGEQGANGVIEITTKKK